MDDFRAVTATPFEEKKVIQVGEGGPYRYTVKVPDFLARWDTWEYWERERFLSMEAGLRRGDILFDIGAESGWMSAIYAQFVGGENMCLFEPTPEYWPNIKATWEANRLPIPKAAFCGLVGLESRLEGYTDYSKEIQNGWPKPAYTGLLINNLKYRYIHSHAQASMQVSVDDFVQTTGIVPSALTLDVEGSEFYVLQGAKATLRSHHPKIWASLHPDLAARNYTPVDEVHALMASVGYREQHLATDHEEHWLFT